MELFIENLKASLPAAFESDEYRERRQALEAAYQQKHAEAAKEAGSTVVGKPPANALPVPTRSSGKGKGGGKAAW